MLSTTQIQNQWADLTGNSASTNTARGLQLYNQQARFYATKYWFSEVAQNFPGGTVAGTSTYAEPYNMKDVIDFYIVAGSLRYTLTEAPNAIFFDQLQFAQYSSDIPQYYWRFNGVTNVFPTPASNGNQITWRYKKRLTDLSQADYTTGTVSITTLTSVITGAGSAWRRNMAGSWIQFTPNETSDTTSGDGNWYQIYSVDSTTQITLVNQYQGPTIAGGAYTIGEMSIIPEDYQVTPLYSALRIYYNSIVPDPNQYKMYDALAEQWETKLDNEYGNKSTDVRVLSQTASLSNPNLYTRSIG